MSNGLWASRRWILPAIGAVLVSFAGPPGGPVARACDTPVYRYAMYNWAPSPYRVYYLCRGEPDKKDAEVNRLLAEQSSVAQSPVAQPPVAQSPSAVQSNVQPASANLVLETVDVTKKDEVEQLPEAVKTAWEKDAGGKLPIHLVFTSWGDLVSAERLDVAAVRPLVESPVRKQIAQLLEKRHAAVFLLFEGKDPAANAQAAKVAREVIARAAKGQFAVEPAGDSAAAPAAAAGAGPTAGAEDAAPTRPQRLQIGLVKLQRADPAEKWLVQSLVTVERDLPEVAGLPMVFPVFGRGRVLAPCIGKGITPENLGRQLELLAGPCSCTVRAQNPGVDLLFRWDWDAAAEALAEEERTLADRQPGPEAAEPGGGAGQTGKSARLEQTRMSALLDPGLVSAQGLPSESPADLPEEGVGSFASGHAWKYGLGLAAIAAGVLTLGLVLVRKRRDDTP